MKDYNPANWYWIVAGDETKLYSSATGNYVQPNNPGYQQWRADEGVPTRIASEAELGEVLAPYSVRPIAPNVLNGYQDVQSRKLTVEVAAKLFFNLENRMRALEGKQAVSAAQYRSVVKGLM